MKKLFISCPMKNRSEENIRMTFDRLHKIAEAVYGESLEVIPTYIEDNPPKCKTEGLWYLQQRRFQEGPPFCYPLLFK